ncbi:Pentatricopeptide repeat-containing protein At3g62470, mitochondrial [Linum perenne]
MGVLIRSQKTLRSLPESYSSISSLLSHLSLSPPSDSIPPPLPLHPPIPSTGSSSFSSFSHGFIPRFSTTHGCRRCRCFRFYSSVSAAASDVVPLAEKPRKNAFFFEEIVQLISIGGSDLQTKLESMQLRIDLKTAKDILRALNSSKVSASRFFDWIAVRHPGFIRNSCICNMLIDNCGRCDDYEKMSVLLADFNQRNVALKKDAFWFLVVKDGDELALIEAVKKVVSMLSRVGGIVYLTGVRSLVEMLANSVSFEMAKFVIGLSDKRVSYHSVLIKEMCKKHEFQRAKDEIKEMRDSYGDEACNLDVRSVYNYMISTMLKAGKEDEAQEMMKSKGFQPDALTFEICICDCVAKGSFGAAVKFFDSMVEAGVEPRRSTHAMLLKMFFDLERYEEAYDYAVAASERFKGSGGDQSFCILAELHRKKGNPVMSKNILCTMMSKGLAPESFVYQSVLGMLKGSEWNQQALDLEQQYEKLRFSAA